MIEATYKLSEEQLKVIEKFNKKIEKEFKKYTKILENSSAEEIFKMSFKTTFIILLRNYLLAEDGLTYSQIEQLMQEDDILNRCYKIFIKRANDKYYKLDYEMEINEILDVVFEE